MLAPLGLGPDEEDIYRRLVAHGATGLDQLTAETGRSPEDLRALSETPQRPWPWSPFRPHRQHAIASIVPSGAAKLLSRKEFRPATRRAARRAE